MAAAAVDKLQRFDSEMSNAAQDTAEAMQVERATDEDADEDLYTRLKTLQRQLEFFEIQVNLLCSHTVDAQRPSAGLTLTLCYVSWVYRRITSKRSSII